MAFTRESAASKLSPAMEEAQGDFDAPGPEDRGLHHRPVRVSREPAMSRHFHEELEALKQTLLAMGGLVEDQIRRVMRALLDRDDTMAQEVIDRGPQPLAGEQVARDSL